MIIENKNACKSSLSLVKWIKKSHVNISLYYSYPKYVEVSSGNYLRMRSQDNKCRRTCVENMILSSLSLRSLFVVVSLSALFHIWKQRRKYFADYYICEVIGLVIA